MNILYCVDNLDRAFFFNRLACGMREHALADCRFVTSRLSAYLYLKRKGHKVHWVRQNKKIADLDVANTLQVLGGRLSLRKASIFASSLWCAIEAIHNEKNIDLLIIWNGTSIEGPVVRRFSEKHNIKTLFLELGNMPGKIFADPQGTNAQSFLARSPSVLDQSHANIDKFEVWRESYLHTKMTKHVVPQAKRNVRYMYARYSGILDWFGYLVCRRPLSNSSGIARRTLKRFILSAAKWNYSGTSFFDEDYVFFPMQVNNDTQLIIHSKISNIQGIRKAHEIAKKNNCQLVVKPHPGESEKHVIASIHALQTELGFLLTNKNTFQLIDHSKCVVTINSTVGLESLLVGKDVHFLADGVLPNLNTKSRLAKYILSYLIDAEYYKNTVISKESLIALIERSSIKEKSVMNHKKMPSSNSQIKTIATT